jgi:hypothetical protein
LLLCVTILLLRRPATPARLSAHQLRQLRLGIADDLGEIERALDFVSKSDSPPSYVSVM